MLAAGEDSGDCSGGGDLAACLSRGHGQSWGVMVLRFWNDPAPHGISQAAVVSCSYVQAACIGVALLVSKKFVQNNFRLLPSVLE